MTCRASGPCNVQKLIEVALERARYEYTEHADNWIVLENKALATATVAGLFLAAVFSYVGNDPPFLDHLLPRILATLLVLSLTAAIFCPMVSLCVRELQMPTSGQCSWDLVRGAIAGRADSDDLWPAYRELLERYLADWLKSTAGIEGKSNSKAAWILRGQVALLIGGVAGAVLAAISIWS
jgi:hypothetical protein